MRELSAARRTASAGSAAKNKAIGANLIRLPLPAECESVEPAYGSPVCSKRASADTTVPPMSKQRPLLDQ